MRPANVFQLEWLAAWGSWRSALLRLGVTLLLGGPWVLLDMPPRVRASGLAMVLMFTGVFGAAVGQERREADGRGRALAVLPIHPARRGWDQFLAGLATRLVPALGLLALFLACLWPYWVPGWAVLCTAWLVLTLAMAQAIGMLVARLVRGGGAVHLLSALVVGAWAFVSGIVPVPPAVSSAIHTWRWLSPAWRLVWRLRMANVTCCGYRMILWEERPLYEPLLGVLGAAVLLIAIFRRAVGWPAPQGGNSPLARPKASAILHATTEPKPSHTRPSADSGSTRP